LIRDRMTKERAETIALGGLAFLAAEPDRIGQFISNSGLDSAALRGLASDPDVLRAVLDQILKDDTLVTEFCREQELDIRDLHVAAHVLGEP
jgi:Protein of unknown function (DUF3572)